MGFSILAVLDFQNRRWSIRWRWKLNDPSRPSSLQPVPVGSSSNGHRNHVYPTPPDGAQHY